MRERAGRRKEAIKTTTTTTVIIIAIIIGELQRQGVGSSSNSNRRLQGMAAGFPRRKGTSHQEQERGAFLSSLRPQMEVVLVPAQPPGVQVPLPVVCPNYPRDSSSQRGLCPSQACQCRQSCRQRSSKRRGTVHRHWTRTTGTGLREAKGMPIVEAAVGAGEQMLRSRRSCPLAPLWLPSPSPWTSGRTTRGRQAGMGQGHPRR